MTRITTVLIAGAVLAIAGCGASDVPARETTVGHTDDRGQESRNEQVSLARAESVRQFLIERGIPADRLVAEGHGEREPIGDNRSMEGRAANRRVEIVIREPAPAATP